MENNQKKRLPFKKFWRKYNRVLIGGTILAVIIGISLMAPLLSPYDPATTDVLHRAAGPSPEHLLGTDSFGRDMFSRLLWGGRITLLVGLMVGICAMAAGIVLGLIAGYYPKADKVIMRLMDGINAFPQMLLALLLLSITESRGIPVVVLALTIGAVPGIARLTRAQVLSIKELEHIEAAMAMGASDIRIMFQYILPLCASPLIIRFTITVASAMLSEAALSFIGVGISPLTPTWGNMLSDGRYFLLTQPWLLYYPGLCIVFTVLSVNMIGDGLRDILDPRLKS